MRGVQRSEKSVLLSVLAGYAAGAAIILSVLVSTILWSTVSNGF